MFGNPEQQQQATAIVKRKQQWPSDIEIKLREHFRVVVTENNGLNGCDIMINIKPSLAVRVYYPNDINRFDEDLKRESPSSSESLYQLLERLHRVDDDEDDVDGLKSFCDLNSNPVCICLLPKINIDRFDNPDSFIHRSQRIMKRSSKGLIMFASDTQDVIKSLLDLVNDLSQRKKRLREKYFLQQRERFFIPNESGIFPKRHAAAAHASEVLRAWANEYSLPAGENNVLMKYMGSIARITTANDRALESVPIEAVTKEFLHAFFGSEGSTARKENNQNTTIPSNVQIPPTNMRVAHQMQGSLVQPTLPSAFRVPSALPAGFDQQMQMQSQYNCSGHPSANPPLVMDNAGYHQGNGGQPMPHPPKVPSMEAANAQTYGFQQPFPSYQQTNGGVLANSSFRINGPSNFAPAGCPPSFQQQMGGDPVFTMEPSMVSNRPNFTSTNRYQQQPQMAGQSYGNPHHQQFYNDNQPPPQMFPGHYQDQLDFQQAPPQAGSLLGSSRGMVSQQQWQQQQQLQYHQQRSAAPPRASQQNNYGRPPVLSNPKFHSRIRRFD